MSPVELRVKLQKYVVDCGVGSRRKVEELIRTGHIYVNNEIVSIPEKLIVPSQDSIKLNDKLITPLTQTYYFLLYKPLKVMSTVSDPQKRKTVMEFVPSGLPVFPVGRLDYQSEGLILLTNDGDFSHAILHPRRHVPKTYVVRVKGMPDLETITRLRNGIFMDGYRAKACFIQLISKNRESSLFKLILEEGKYHQIRNMFEYSHYPVISLKRIKIGNLTIGNLKPGEYRNLTRDEIRELITMKYDLKERLKSFQRPTSTDDKKPQTEKRRLFGKKPPIKKSTKKSHRF